jgi:hypothetical protein
MLAFEGGKPTKVPLLRLSEIRDPEYKLISSRSIIAAFGFRTLRLARFIP